MLESSPHGRAAPRPPPDSLHVCLGATGLGRRLGVWTETRDGAFPESLAAPVAPDPRPRGGSAGPWPEPGPLATPGSSHQLLPGWLAPGFARGAGGPSGGSPGWPGLLGSEWCCPGSGRLAEGLPGATVFIPSVDQAPVVAAQSRERAQIRDSWSPPGAPPGCGLRLWGDLAPGSLLLGCGSSASVLSAGHALPRTSQPALLPLVRFGESRTDQAHGEREGPRPPHACTHVCSHSSHGPLGQAPQPCPALPGSIWEAQWDQRRGRRRVSTALGGPPATRGGRASMLPAGTATSGFPGAHAEAPG